MQDVRNDRPGGRVVGLWRYPVKSMAAEALAEVDVSWHGLAGDRRWAFIRSDVPRSGFPWLTLRQRADLNHYRPAFTEPERPDKSPTVVHTPSGAVLDVTDPALAAELDPSGIRLIKQDRGIFDTAPLSVVTTQTLARLGEMVGDLRMRIDQRDGRCVVITIDPATTVRTPEILRTVARERQGCVGVYGATVTPGRIAIGDAVVVESPA